MKISNNKYNYKNIPNQIPQKLANSPKEKPLNYTSSTFNPSYYNYFPNINFGTKGNNLKFVNKAIGSKNLPQIANDLNSIKTNFHAMMKTNNSLGRLNMIYETAFGKNDIRGIYGEDISEELFFYTGRGYIRFIAEKTGKLPEQILVTICRDARLSSPSLNDALTKGVLSLGARVIDLGLAPTPIGYYSEVKGINRLITQEQEIDGALIVTASHNPSQYNGLKMTFDKHSLNEEQIKEVKALTLAEHKQYPPQIMQAVEISAAKLQNYDLIHDYVSDLSSQFGKIGAGIKVVVDSANSTGGIVAPRLYRALGCEVIELYSNPDGRFPHHHPNPSDERTLIDLKKAVVANNADLGIAFDGDSDRIGVVTSEGEALTGDKLLLIYANDYLDSLPDKSHAPAIVSEVKCSQVLYDTINQNGGSAIMCKTGHGYIKSKMRETGALLAGEMSGHVFFKDRYHGFDDAVYAGCRIIEIVSKHKSAKPEFKMNELLEPFRKVFISKEIRLPCPNNKKKIVLDQFQNYVAEHPKMFSDDILDIVTLDGMRIVFSIS